jgi:hypothetical protein
MLVVLSLKPPESLFLRPKPGLRLLLELFVFETNVTWIPENADMGRNPFLLNPSGMHCAPV